MPEIKEEDIVIGQYVGNEEGKTEAERLGYLDDPTVPKGELFFELYVIDHFI